MTEPGLLAGQVAVVTGGGRGIGAEIARTLGAAGAAVAVVARSADQVAATVAAVRAGGGTALGVPGDVADPRSVDEAASTVEAALGPVDLLVCAAGRNQAIGPLWDVDHDVWWDDVTVNLRGPALWGRRVLASMVERGRGRIVNVVSGSALAPHPYGTAYGCSKAALAHLTASLAAEVESHGPAVFALSPGSVRTELSIGATESPAARRWRGDLGRELAGRWTTPDRAARAVVLLASGRADGLSGRFLHVDDDIEDLAARADEVRAADAHRLVLRRLDP